MEIREGEVFRHSTGGVSFTVKQIVNKMVVLESQDGKRQISGDDREENRETREIRSVAFCVQATLLLTSI